MTAMLQLTEQEKAMLAGAEGEPRRLAMEHMVQVAGFFDAEDLVPVSQVHVMADSEALGEAGTAFLERLAAAPEAERRVCVPTVSDPRGADFKAYQRLRQDEAIVAPPGSSGHRAQGKRYRPGRRRQFQCPL